MKKKEAHIYFDDELFEKVQSAAMGRTMNTTVLELIKAGFEKERTQNLLTEAVFLASYVGRYRDAFWRAKSEGLPLPSPQELIDAYQVWIETLERGEIEIIWKGKKF
jgi:hypothetical protein